MVVIKLPYLKSSMLCSKLSKGIGHNNYGILSDKCIGILSIFYLPGVLFLQPFGENLNRYQNPFRRPIMLSIFMCGSFYSIWLSLGPLVTIFQALPFM